MPAILALGKKGRWISVSSNSSLAYGVSSGSASATEMRSCLENVFSPLNSIKIMRSEEV